MEGDEFTEFIVTKQPTKMYSSYSNNDEAGEDTKDIFSYKRQPLTTKTALELLLDGTLKYKVCRYCLNVDTSLYEMDQVFQIGGQGTLYKVTIKDMVACFYPFQIIEDSNYPKKICENCLDKAMQAYLFTQKCEQSGRALHNCFEDMYEKLDKLDPIERTKKRGRQKLNPNFNTLFAEHKKVIDYAEPIINIINKGSQLVEENVDKITDLECPRCWQTFTNLESLMNHEKIHPKSMWFHCRLCGNSFVKRHLYRKHVKSVHSQSKPAPLPEHGFKCSECDVGNETYDQHLQHVEKHKFQMVIEHLVEKKMDKLCTVCMTKDIDMVKLDKTVNIHGGCPELTGHRSLHNIIGSTMPEQASYKYRELLVANEAKIVTITKKLKNYFLRGNKIIPVMNKEKYYPLSNPIIISREIIDGEDYLFLFTKPNDIEQIITVNESFDKAKPNDIEQIITVNESFDKDMVNKNEIEQQNVENFTVMEIVTQALHTSSVKNDIDYENKFTFHFSKPDYDIDVQNEHKDTTNVKISDNIRAKNKQINWIFGKCYEDNDNTEAKEDVTRKYDMSDETKAGIKECNYCWIFKNTDKCNNCQKSFKVDSAKVPNKTNDSTEQIQDIEANENKRKIVEHNNTGNKRSKWQCKFCLTNNGDNEKCYCCDTEYQTKDFSHQIKINFGSNKSFFGIDDFSKKSMNIDNNDVIGLTPHKENADVAVANSEKHNNIVLEDEFTKNIKITPIEINKAIQPEITIDLDQDMDTERAIDVVETPIVDISDFQEEMDVEEYNISYDTNTELARENVNNQMTSVLHSYNSTNMPLNFNIGVGTSDVKGRNSRRIRRPLRRIATTRS